MKNKWWIWAILFVFTLILGWTVACSSGDDDDSTSDDDATDDDTFLPDDDATDDDVDDDTVDDDTTVDDDSVDDDTTTGNPPVLGTFHLYVGSPDFPNFMGETSPYVVGLHEIAFVVVEWSDSDKSCDLKGGSMWYKLDNGDATKVPGAIGDIGCQYSASSPSLVGYDLRDIDGAMVEAAHTLEVWWFDDAGNESNHRTLSYSVEDAQYRIGTVMEAWTLVDQDGNNVSLSDYPDTIVVIEGLTGWCTYCRQEAAQNALLQTEYTANGDPVQIVGFMGETNGGSSNVQQADLQAWVTAYGWDTAGIPNLADGGFAVLSDYFLIPNGGVPYNMIIDQDHVIQTKWHGYGSGMVDMVVDQLLAD